MITSSANQPESKNTAVRRSRVSTLVRDVPLWRRVRYFFFPENGPLDVESDVFENSTRPMTRSLPSVQPPVCRARRLNDASDHGPWRVFAAEPFLNFDHTSMFRTVLLQAHWADSSRSEFSHVTRARARPPITRAMVDVFNDPDDVHCEPNALVGNFGWFLQGLLASLAFLCLISMSRFRIARRRGRVPIERCRAFFPL